MAITLIAEPYDFSPAYNPLKFIYDSTNKNLDGFRYIFQVFPEGGSTAIATYRPLPEITTGYGEVDLSRLLQNYTDQYQVSTSLGTTVNPAAAYYNYDVKVGEEYVTMFSYTASLTQNGTFTKITVTHSFIVGDRVVIAQSDGGVANPSLEGLFTVTAINGTTDFTVNSLWSEVTDATINGEVKYSDNRKTVTYAVTTTLDKYVFNGAVNWLDWASYSQATYQLTAATDEWITTMPQEFTITPTENLFMLAGNNLVTTGHVVFENSNGDILSYPVTNANVMTMCAVGATAIPTTVIAGTVGVIKADTEYYDFWYANAAYAQHSVKYRVNIDRRCAISSTEIMFMDRLGSWGSFAFQLREYTRGTVTKQSYNQHIDGEVVSTRWKYASRDQGYKVVNPYIDQTIELNTNYMTEDMATYFSELVSSPYCWIRIGGIYQSCIVQTTDFELSKTINGNLIRKSITVKLANQDTING